MRERERDRERETERERKKERCQCHVCAWLVWCEVELQYAPQLRWEVQFGARILIQEMSWFVSFFIQVGSLPRSVQLCLSSSPGSQLSFPVLPLF